MPEFNVEISGNLLTISESSTILYQVTAGKIILHSKIFPKLVDEQGRDWSKDIREAPENERPEFRISYIFNEPERTIDLFVSDGYVIVREGIIIRFQMKADSVHTHCDREGVYDDGWDPVVEAVEFTLHKKGRFQYIESHSGDLLRIDLDSGDHINVSELERMIQFRKNPQKKVISLKLTEESPPDSTEELKKNGCCGCILLFFAFLVLLNLLGLAMG